jgi:hypothetical protein
VRLLIQVEDDHDEVESLRDWLEHDENVQRDGDLGWGTVTDPEHQGVDIQTLSFAATTLLGTGNLVLAIVNWRRSRPAQPVVTITRELADGTVVRIDTFDPEALAEAVRKLGNG